MADFKIHNWKVPIQDEPETSDDSIMAQGRMFDGTLYKNRRSEKQKWDIETTWMTKNNAETVEYLLRGRGHTWSFDDQNLISSKGIKGIANGSPTYSSSGNVASGFGSYIDTGGGTITFTLDGDYVDGFTVYVWEDNSGWDHWVITGDGSVDLNGDPANRKVWKNQTLKEDESQTGVVSEPLSVSINQSADEITFTLDDSIYDDLVILPWEVSDDLAGNWVDISSPSPHGELPKIEVRGEVLPGEPEQRSTATIVQGKDEDISTVGKKMTLNGSYQHAKQVSFVIVEA